MINMSIGEIGEMRRMGWKVRARYQNHRGVPFHKNFKDRAEMDEFTAKAETAGSTLIEFREI